MFVILFIKYKILSHQIKWKYTLWLDYKPDACNPNPCKNGSECSKDNHGRFKCKCQDGYYGSICIDGIYIKFYFYFDEDILS